MTDNPAELLRHAAERVRNRTATATPGPWTVNSPAYAEAIYGPTYVPVVSGSRWGGEASVFEATEDAMYIALMHPGVGAALAEWLDTVAGEMTAVEGTEYRAIGNGHDFESWNAALAVARAVLGEAAE